MQTTQDPASPAIPEVSRRFLAGIGLLVAAIGFSAHSFVASTETAATASPAASEFQPEAEHQAYDAPLPSAACPAAEDIVRPSADCLRDLGLDLGPRSTAPA